jgi:hypothetical protein
VALAASISPIERTRRWLRCLAEPEDVLEEEAGRPTGSESPRKLQAGPSDAGDASELLSGDTGSR